jgi:hypothetical protein
MQETQIAKSYVLVVLIEEAGVKVLRTRVVPGERGCFRCFAWLPREPVEIGASLHRPTSQSIDKAALDSDHIQFYLYLYLNSE